MTLAYTQVTATRIRFSLDILAGESSYFGTVFK